jgi:hypothetical protein
MSFIQNIQKTMVFNAVKGVLNGLKTVALLTPTPWDDLALTTLLAVMQALRNANTKPDALTLISLALPDDERTETA